MRIIGRDSLKAIFTKTRLNVLLFLWLALCSCLFMVVSAACIFLSVRYWWLPTNQVQLPVDFVSKAVKAPGTLPSRRELVAIVNLKEVVSLVPMDYSIDIELDMPKSTANRQLGNFALRGVLSNVPWGGDFAPDVLLTPSHDKTEKMCLFPFQSNVIRFVESLAFMPLYLLGLKKESSTLSVRLWESAKQPLRDHPFLLINVDKPVWISTATLIFTVRLQGVSYFLHKYPISTFVLGTAFICEVELLSAVLALLFYALKSSAGDERARSAKSSKTDAATASSSNDGIHRQSEKNRYGSTKPITGSSQADYGKPHSPTSTEHMLTLDEDRFLIPEWFSKTESDKNITEEDNGRSSTHKDYATKTDSQATASSARNASSPTLSTADQDSECCDLPLSPAPSP